MSVFSTIANAEPLTVHWNCPQSTTTILAADPHRLPQTQRFELEVGPPASLRGEDARISLTFPETYLQMLNRAALSQTSYLGCLIDTFNHVRVALFRRCRFNWAPGWGPGINADAVCERLSEEAVTQESSLASMHITGDNRARMPSMIPMDSAANTPNFQQATATINTLFEQAIRNRSCPSEVAIERFYPLILSREFLMEQLPRHAERLTPDCRTNLHARMTDYLSDTIVRRVGECEQEYSAEDPRCHHLRQAVAQTMSRLSLLANSSLARRATTTFTDCYSSSSEIGSAEFMAFVQNYFSDVAPCTDLQPGQSQIVNLSASESPTGIPVRYRLRKIAPSVSVADVRITFHPRSQQAAYEAHAARCLRQASHYLRGPHGERLILNLSNNAEVPESHVDLMTASFRDHSEAWSIHTDCATTTHEVLHLLGLVDEYEERALGYMHDPVTGELRQYSMLGTAVSSRSSTSVPDKPLALAYTCRIVGPPTSIMNQSDLVWARAITGDVPSIITPAAFRSITRPGCRAVNSGYYRCSQQAYRDPQRYGSCDSTISDDIKRGELSCFD